MLDMISKPDKKVVWYEKTVGPVIPGQPAYIIPINHPNCSNKGNPARTSAVLRYSPKTGEIETLHTRYWLYGKG